jgi:hypothetical protein
MAYGGVWYDDSHILARRRLVRAHLHAQQHGFAIESKDEIIKHQTSNGISAAEPLTTPVEHRSSSSNIPADAPLQDDASHEELSDAHSSNDDSDTDNNSIDDDTIASNNDTIAPSSDISEDDSLPLKKKKKKKKTVSKSTPNTLTSLSANGSKRIKWKHVPFGSSESSSTMKKATSSKRLNGHKTSSKVMKSGKGKRSQMLDSAQR